MGKRPFFCNNEYGNVAKMVKQVKNGGSPLAEGRVVGLDHEGRGVARQNGKAVFIRGALLGEKVLYRINREDRRFDEADAVQIVEASDYRQEPPCPHYGDCGGCSMQHIEFSAQVAFKQRVVEEQCLRLAKSMPEQILPPIYGLPWHYRERGRLSVCSDEKGRLKIGFQARKSRDTINISTCPILPRHLTAILPLLKKQLHSLSNILKGIEFAVGIGGITALNLLFTHKPSDKQTGCLHELQTELGSDWHLSWQAAKGGVHLSDGGKNLLHYRLTDFDIDMAFTVGSFTQVNAALNNLMVRRAVDSIAPEKGDRIADLFCGIGNFSLPLARSGAEITGIEGLAELTGQACANARRNNLTNLKFQTADLFKTERNIFETLKKSDKILLDPPRAGAHALAKALPDKKRPARIVYVSCNSATFARDVAEFVKKGYKFKKLGIMNLFSQTAHVESVGCFER